MGSDYLKEDLEDPDNLPALDDKLVISRSRADSNTPLNQKKLTQSGQML